MDRRHIGRDAFQATQILDEVKKAHDSMLEKLNSIYLASITNAANTSRSLSSNVFDVDQEDGGGINDDAVIVIDNYDDGTRNEQNVTTTPQRRSDGILISWGNVRQGRINLLPRSYKFPVMTLRIFLNMWFCGDKSKNIPSFIILQSADVKHLAS